MVCVVFIFMELKEVMNAIEKYIGVVIMRRFPELIRFAVRTSRSGRRIPDHIIDKHPEGTKFHLIDVTFYFDEMENKRRDDLYESVKNMTRYLSLPERFNVRHYLEHN